MGEEGPGGRLLVHFCALNNYDPHDHRAGNPQVPDTDNSRESGYVGESDYLGYTLRRAPGPDLFPRNGPRSWVPM